MKTARFAQVVSKCGSPLVHDQWLPLEKDAALKKAVKENRVMTVHIHTVGTKKDYGEVGLVKAGQRVLLLFPKSLRAFEDRRVVGINYELLKELPQRPKKKADEKKEKKRLEDEEAEAASRSSEALLRLFRPEKEPEPKEEEQTQDVPADAEEAEEEKDAAPKRKAGAKTAKQRGTAKRATKRGKTDTDEAAKTDSADEAVSAGEKRLRAEIKKAMKQLQSGKAVQAYQTLEKAMK